MSMTKVYLLNVPLEADYSHTLYFASASAQQTYFKSKILFTGDNFSYQRKDNIIRYPSHMDALLGCNYVMYQNTKYNNKWFYAFITKMEYINDERTDIYIETDVIQTWYFDYEVKPSFIEREHVNDDTIGIHTVDEGIETGDYLVNSYYADENLTKTKIVMAATVLPDNPESTSYGGIYNGIYSGVKYYTYDTDTITAKLQNIENKSEGGVSALFLAPEFLCENTSGAITQTKFAESYGIDTDKVTALNKLDGYTPKNKKLLTFPYCYLLVTNGASGSAVYKYEYFQSRDVWFGVLGSLTPGCSIRCVPIAYKNQSNDHYDEGLTLGKYPQCNWATDHYTNWLTQNGVNVNGSIINAGISAVKGGVAGAIAGAGIGGVGAIPGAIIGGTVGAVSGLTQIFSSIQQTKNADMVAPQVYGNINSGDVMTAYQVNTFHFYGMSIKQEFAKIIDGYFSMYGYKINAVKTPNKNHRENYWFTKTIDANIRGAIPNDDILKIKKIYDSGITFWKNSSNIRDYSVSNNIV